MKKVHEKWSISDLIKHSNDVEFPEFQREPTIWKLEKKQRLIDSIFRDFDISSVYFFKRKDKKYDCIDGQQRINAIWSYLGINDKDEDNKFHSKITNEIYDDAGRFDDVDQKRYDSLAKKWKDLINNYELNVVVFTDTEEDEELNLQFIRLQLGAPLNAGEKLNAMTGNMRDKIFNEIKGLAFFNKIKIQKRRFACEQIAAQMVLNAFSKRELGEFHRSRYIDLQEFFKEKEKFGKEEEKILKEVKDTLNKVEKAFGDKIGTINNRALAVSVYLFSSELIEQGLEKELPLFVDFFVKFVRTMRWQIPKGLNMDREYSDLLNFQTNITQAAGEKTAIQKRHDFWRDYFYEFKKNKIIKGDKEFKKKGGDPDKERSKVILK
jgi:hypothetical protein